MAENSGIEWTDEAEKASAVEKEKQRIATAEDLANMTNAEFYIECADVVQHMLAKLSKITRTMAAVCRTQDADSVMAKAVVEFGMYGKMMALADILDNLDSVDESDEWTHPMFEEMHRRFPKGT